MSLLHPVGPEPAQTYWARRALLFGAAVVLTVAVALIIITGSSRSSAVQANPSPPTVGDMSLSSASPSPIATAVSTPSAVDPTASVLQTSPAPKATTRKASTKKSNRSSAVDCAAKELRPTLTGKQRLAPKKPNTFQLSLINGSEETCIARVTKKNFELTISSGSDRIWSTADCPSIIKSISRKLGSEYAVAWTLTWDGKRSKSNCKTARKAPSPGKYVVTAQLDGAEPVELRMLLRD
jgi:hypothetical protein